jgi:hypothetical protein
MRYDTKQDSRDADDESGSIDRHFSRAKVVLSALGLAVTVGLALASLVDNIQRSISDLSAAIAVNQAAIESCHIDQQPDRLCHRISACGAATNASMSDMRSQISNLTGILIERGMRIDNLESKVYDLAQKPKARPDPFTGTMGQELERRLNERIKALEESKP